MGTSNRDEEGVFVLIVAWMIRFFRYVKSIGISICLAILYWQTFVIFGEQPFHQQQDALCKCHTIMWRQTKHGVPGTSRFPNHKFFFSLSKCHRNDESLLTSPSSPFKSLAPLLNDPRPMLIILLLRDPQLMKSAQTSQNAPADPTPKLPLHHLPRRHHPHPDPWIRNLQLLLQSIREPRVPRGRSRDDDVSQKVGAKVDVDLGQRGGDQRDDGLTCGRWRVGGVREGHFVVEDAFDGTIPVKGGEQLVPAVGHLEGFAGMLFRDVDVRPPLLGMPAESPRSGPDVHDALFELGEHALFLELPE